MRIGIATDHGGFGLKEDLLARLRAAGHEVLDFGAHSLNSGDDYPDFVIPLARAVAAGELARAVRAQAVGRPRGRGGPFQRQAAAEQVGAGDDVLPAAACDRDHAASVDRIARQIISADVVEEGNGDVGRAAAWTASIGDDDLIRRRPEVGAEICESSLSPA